MENSIRSTQSKVIIGQSPRALAAGVLRHDVRLNYLQLLYQSFSLHHQVNTRILTDNGCSVELFLWTFLDKDRDTWLRSLYPIQPQPKSQRTGD